MKDRVLYHHWSKDGKIVFKKQLDIKDSRVKIFSSKRMSNKDTGKWQIQLVDKKGKIFCEAGFEVNVE